MVKQNRQQSIKIVFVCCGDTRLLPSSSYQALYWEILNRPIYLSRIILKKTITYVH